MHSLIALSDWFLNRAVFPAFRDRVRGRTFILVIALGIFGNSWLALALPELPAEASLKNLVIGQTFFLIFLLIYTKFTGQYRVTAIAYFVIQHSHVCFVMLQAHSMFSVHYASMGTRVVVAAFILGVRLAIPLVIFYGLTTIFVVQTNASYGIQVPFDMSFETFSTVLTSGLIMAQLTIVFFSWLYHGSLQQDYARLKRDRARFLRSARTLDLSHMLGELNHHINNPLSIVHASFYRLSTQPDLWKAGVENSVGQAIQKMRFIVDHLKLLSTPDSSEPETLISVRHLCVNLLTHFQERFRLKGAEFRFEDHTINLSFRSRRHEIFTFLAGLIQNAGEAVESSPVKRVTLRIERRDIWVLFTVIDTGPGIPEDMRSQIFKPFYSTKKGSSHSGLTLVTTRAQLEDRGGFLNYEPGPQGSAFQLGLPYSN